jgi:hypothetical protein
MEELWSLEDFSQAASVLVFMTAAAPIGFDMFGA